jgi:hypothetical protein
VPHQGRVPISNVEVEVVKRLDLPEAMAAKLIAFARVVEPRGPVLCSPLGAGPREIEK